MKKASWKIPIAKLDSLLFWLSSSFFTDKKAVQTVGYFTWKEQKILKKLEREIFSIHFKRVSNHLSVNFSFAKLYLQFYFLKHLANCFLGPRKICFWFSFSTWKTKNALIEEFAGFVIYVKTTVYSRSLCKTLRRQIFFHWFEEGTEAVVQRCSVKKVFLEISQNSQENTIARVSFA